MNMLNLVLILISFFIYTPGIQKSSINLKISSDTSTVIKLNNQAFRSRLTDPDITISEAKKALALAEQINYINGIAESYRVIGVGNSYKNSIEAAIDNYLNALSYFKQTNNLEGEAKVYNNIGNLYRGIDYNKSLENFEKSLTIATKLNIKDLIAGLKLNIGTAYQQQKNYSKALTYYQESLTMFENLNNKIGIIQSHQNLGVLYLNLRDFNSAESHLINALKKSKEEKLNNSIAAINLTLSSVHIAQSRYEEAEKTIEEGLKYAELLQDSKLIHNYTLTSYELESKRKNYFQALNYLRKAYRVDSARYVNNVSDKIRLLQAQHVQLEKQRENELTIARQKNTRIFLWASIAIAIMAFFVIFLLVKIVGKSANNNRELSRLNLEISKQKDDLDTINQNLEEIIEDRTRDIKIKNKKLSEYSSHLSHQIRSPVATLKGLMLLDKDNLIERDELLEQIGKCVYDLDDKIINMNENLNNPQKSSLMSDE